MATNHPPTSANGLEVIAFRPRGPGSGALRGFVDIRLSNGLTILNLLLFEKGNDRWTRFPLRQWADKTGTLRDAPIIQIEDRDRQLAFDRAVLVALAKYTKEVR